MKTENNCEKKNNCCAIIALCISIFTLGLVLGNWIGKCTQKSSQWKSKKCESYYTDGKSGSTCDWSKSKQKSYEDQKKFKINKINFKIKRIETNKYF